MKRRQPFSGGIQFNACTPPPPKHAAELPPTPWQPQGPQLCHRSGELRRYCDHCKELDRLVAITRAAELTEDERMRWLVGPLFFPLERWACP